MDFYLGRKIRMRAETLKDILTIRTAHISVSVLNCGPHLHDPSSLLLGAQSTSQFGDKRFPPHSLDTLLVSFNVVHEWDTFEHVRH